jgi:epoxyqueuosine reductase
MNILLHICCAPCTIYPLQTLRNEGFQVHGYFYNPNIHPFREYEKRRETLKEYAGICKLRIYYDDQYDLRFFLNQTQPWGPDRCRVCYAIRLEATAQQAKTQGFAAFSTTLLYSRYQKHDWIKEVGINTAERFEIPFHYQDFRPGWQEGIHKSRELGLYRQPYCGCIFSEQERFAWKASQ